jgi:hypothetical protein
MIRCCFDQLFKYYRKRKLSTCNSCLFYNSLSSRIRAERKYSRVCACSSRLSAVNIFSHFSSHFLLFHVIITNRLHSSSALLKMCHNTDVVFACDRNLCIRRTTHILTRQKIYSNSLLIFFRETIVRCKSTFVDSCCY